jgi:hypothetical protein
MDPPISIKREINVLPNIQAIEAKFDEINFSSQNHLVFKNKKVRKLKL